MSSSPSSPKAAAAMTTATCGRSSKYKCLRSYPLLPNHNNHSNKNAPPLPPTLRLTVAQGSVVDFRHPYGAIVNAANEGCLGGGGVDGAISTAGGRQLALDREALPIVQGRYTRCPTGHAKLTGPATTRNRRDDDDNDDTNNSIATYGDLGVPYVIHAVGPNYMQFDEDNDVGTPNRLLRSAYKASLDCCKRTHRPKTDESNNNKEQPPPIRAVGFSLLSAGIFRGDQTLTDVLGIGVKALRDWARDQSNNEDDNPQHDQLLLEEIMLFAFTDREAKTLLRVCDWVLLGKKPEQKSGSSSAKKVDPPGQKTETNNNAEVNLVAKNENDSTMAETDTTAADETKDAATVDANESSKKRPADPEAGPPGEDKIMTDVEDNGSSGAEDSPVKSDLVAEANTVEDAPEEEKVMTDAEQEATIVAKNESPPDTKRTVEMLKTTTAAASEDKVMTDVESLESREEFLESEASNKETTTTTCKAGNQKTMDTATTEKKDPN